MKNFKAAAIASRRLARNKLIAWPFLPEGKPAEFSFYVVLAASQWQRRGRANRPAKKICRLTKARRGEEPTMKKRLIHTSILILLASASAFAEQVIKAQIPFPFHMGGSVLPSGSYTVDTGIGSQVLRFRSADGKSSVVALSYAAESAAIPAQPKLVFNRYGSQYFLSQVWAGDRNRGHELLKSRIEKEVAAAATRTTAALLATK